MAKQARTPKTRAPSKTGPEQTAKVALRGNRNSVKHGAHAKPSAAAVRAQEDAIYASLAASAPVRQGNALPAADEAAVRLCARTLARLESVSAWLDAHGPLDRRGRPRSASLWERRLTATAAKQLASLGMSPSSRARLGVDVARIDLASALSEPDEQRRAVLLREAGLEAGAGYQPCGDAATDGSLPTSHTQNENDI